MSMTMGSRNPLHSELRSAVMQRQDSVKQMYGYSSRRDSGSDIAAPASWAASSLSLPNDAPMVNVLDELRKKSKRKKKKHSSTRHESGSTAQAEVRRLQEELQERINTRGVSLYSADGAVSGDRKASLDVTKKSILEEIRRKSSRRKKSGRNSSSGPDDYGLLGSTKSNVLDELKKNSKKKKRRNKGSPRASSDDGTEEERTRPGSRSPVPSSVTEHERIMQRFENNEKSLSQFEENEKALSRFEDRGRDRTRRREDVDRGTSRFDDQDKPYSAFDQLKQQLNSNIRHLRTEEASRNNTSRFETTGDPKRRSSNQNDASGRVPPKSSLHSELKKRFKSPSRSRTLMYKYSNYRHDQEGDDDDDASQPQRAFLHEELQTRVKRTAPRYSRYTTDSDTKSNIHDELKSRLSSDRRQPSSRSSSKLDSAFNKERNRQLDEGGSRHSAGGGSRGSGGGSRGSGGNSRASNASSFYIPGITAKARTLESNQEEDDDDVETQDTHDETVSTTASSSFFIPGINGTARCLNGSRTTATASRRASAFSATSDESGNSGSDRPDRMDRPTRSYRRSSNYGGHSTSDDSGDQMDRSSDRFESRRRTTNRRRERSSDRTQERRASSPCRLRGTESGTQASSVDLDDIIRGAQSKLSSAPRKRDY